MITSRGRSAGVASRSYQTFEEWCDREFPQWRFAVDVETRDAVKWMRQAFNAGRMLTTVTVTGTPHPDPITGKVHLKRD